MPTIDGEYSHSVTQGLARRAYKKSQKDGGHAAAPGDAGADAGGGKDGKAVMAAHGEHGAKKSFHAYDHGTHVSAHAHNHETGEHEQRDHDSIEEAHEHMREHMGGEGGGSAYDDAGEVIEKAGAGGETNDVDDGEIGGIE